MALASFSLSAAVEAYPYPTQRPPVPCLPSSLFTNFLLGSLQGVGVGSCVIGALHKVTSEASNWEDLPGAPLRNGTERAGQRVWNGSDPTGGEDPITLHFANGTGGSVRSKCG